VETTMIRKCYTHPKNDAIGTCHYCGRCLCSECVASWRKGYYYCKDQSDCLTFQEKESDISSSTLKGEIEEGGTVKGVSIEETDRPDQLNHRPAKQKIESYYPKLVRAPRSLRDAVVMAEILTRPRFRKR
jgi:hypothetical protein